MKLKLKIGICIIAGSAACNQAKSVGMKQKMLSAPTSTQHYVLVKDLNHTTKIVDVEFGSSKVRLLKEKIRDFSGIPEDDQIILFNGKYLRDEVLLSSYNIGRGSNLLLSTKGLKGGMYIKGPHGKGQSGVGVSNLSDRFSMCRGVSLFGYCTKCCGQSSSFHNTIGSINGKMGRGLEMHSLLRDAKCHIHNTPILKKDINELVFYKCKFELVGTKFDLKAKNFEGKYYRHVDRTDNEDLNGYIEYPKDKWEPYVELWIKAVGI